MRKRGKVKKNNKAGENHEGRMIKKDSFSGEFFHLLSLKSNRDEDQ